MSSNTMSLIERVNAQYSKLVELEADLQELAQLREEVHQLRTAIFGTAEEPVEVVVPQLPAPKVVGVVHGSDGKRHLSDEAKKHISEALRAKSAARKAAAEAIK